MNKFYKILRFILLIVSCGFYTLHVGAVECPGHPKGPSEIEEEQERERRKKDPTRELGDENQKKEILSKSSY
ncbi:hypothetical protein LCGC14_1303170 [marine sediment metagenome]|uniref:Uncharacterized protein n=1 Tax=marine sediment metagenome TaxID=412755 RepID=A0A0F9NRY4_9ZZZZ